MKTRIILFAATLLALPSAIAGDGNYWKGLCNSESNIDQVACALYVRGVVDGALAYSYTLQVPRPFCLPDNVKVSQVADVFKKYLDDNPQLLHVQGVTLVGRSIRDAFPCYEAQDKNLEKRHPKKQPAK